MLVAAATPAKAEDWTGFYAGLQATNLNFDVDWKNPGTPEQDADGILAGGVIGYDLQFGHFVVGVLADAHFGSLSDFERDGNYIIEEVEVTATGSFRVRAGITLLDERMLIYGTGGIAWANMEQSQSCTGPAATVAGWCKTHGPYDLRTNETLWGPTYGGGVEMVLGDVGWSKITVFAEYLQTSYRDQNFKMSPDAKGNPLPDQIVQATDRSVKVGLKFRF